MRKHKNKIIAGVVIAIVLAFVFWYGGDAPGLRGWTSHSKETATVVQNDEPAKKEAAEAQKTLSETPVKEENAPATKENKQHKQDETPVTPTKKIAMPEKIAESTPYSNKEQNKPLEEKTSSVEIKQSNEENFEEQEMLINEVTDKDGYLTNPIPEGKPVPIEPENVVITDIEHTCTLSVRCDTILQNIGWLDAEKVDIVPKDGVVFPEKTVTFYEGESVFNLLMREMKRNKIHFEFEDIPIYNSAYIEGINNLYEFDCGEVSGWMYKVNGWFPNYGSSRYQLKQGDRVEWVYTCNSGVDVGGQYTAKRN